MPPKNQQRNLLTSLVLVSPLFVIYQIGVLFTLPMLNGADFVTTLLLRDLKLSIPAYLGFVVGVVLVLLVGLSRLKKRQHFQTAVIVPVLLESTIYALTMGSLIVFVMTSIFRFSPGLAGGVSDSSMLGRLVMSIGAGLYEETVFRLGLITGLVAIFERVLGWGRWVAIVAAFVASSFLFSAMHHIPPYGDPLSLGVFTFRFLAGIFFGLLFWFRGFAVAVYTHAIYDVYVLLIR